MSVSIKKTGVVSASGEIGRNLFIGSDFSPSVIANFVSNSSQDWTKPLRYYNGAQSLHTFDGLTDIINLKYNTGNIGICFARLATDMNMDTSSYYTISCEAKCTKSGAHLDIGLSYMNTSDSWVWRGGTGAQNFTAVDTWQKFTRTFKPDADTKVISYCFTVIGVSSSSDPETFCIRHCKLEKGSIATPWCPASEDEYYVSSICGANEIGATQASIYKGLVNAPDFIEI